MRSLETRLGRVEKRQGDSRQAFEAATTRYAHLSRPELEREVVKRMREYLMARSYPEPVGRVAPHAVEQAHSTFRHLPSALVAINVAVAEQEKAYATH